MLMNKKSTQCILLYGLTDLVEQYLFINPNYNRISLLLGELIVLKAQLDHVYSLKGLVSLGVFIPL